MIDLTLAEVAAATGGELVHGTGAEVVTGSVEFDSREVGPGGLFVAFDGAKVDGHDFAAAAVGRGATGVLGTRDTGVPGVLVDDPLAALARLARHVADRLPQLTVVGLTGSSGKTTTKDLTAQLAARIGPTVAPPGSFNNELGHPWTVLKAGAETRFLVLEMGARGIGHIKHLCDVAPPRIGVVLNVGTSHIGEFGSVENIALAKGELAEAVPADGGVAVLNADDPRVRAMAARTRGRVVLVGEAADADVRAEDVTLDERGRASYTLVTAHGRAAVTLAVSGRHQVGNTLAAAAVALELGMPFAELPQALGELRLVSTRRMDVFDRPDGVTVIDDSYNANPGSVATALRALAAVGAGRRTTAVLGYMAELGDFEHEGHAQVGRLAAELGVDRLVVVDAAAAPIAEGARAHAGWTGKEIVVPDQPAAVAELARDLRSGDVVLVKASRYRTWEVADALRDPATLPVVTA
ncbi:UDP-N-acetylmuramoyl-tripeptide--D-alanyl-D-alanine ligase [Spirilliplanes yamanashiensis]|uniref:UDP-N-acetylmuramoyl-tripeptide--D-alanyl-D-alanine ligase n=1 Tax=Spirilliplanes yamanashiensis TaxID=42233 RepID=A0A8J4DIS2_9ACTN|nr:UDP-N-acetylmuramoyl-tripeptide--D-alanyl-D-alanine ligase [Spirilliplanes yamanashiensis]MDP9816956.1 UDP-N-acetylmuramoyl-tripeptide--D-alanyl-D-alanine ligase [Spirilliplanes yamanashiensis]GIJ03387.1 UDP-N-acetylmuramoyl-tripeptide--D-alanyl-D-alanine ligase [Spirilliplanes yamanashiensis]